MVTEERFPPPAGYRWKDQVRRLEVPTPGGATTLAAWTVVGRFVWEAGALDVPGLATAHLLRYLVRVSAAGASGEARLYNVDDAAEVPGSLVSFAETAFAPKTSVPTMPAAGTKQIEVQVRKVAGAAGDKAGLDSCSLKVTYS